MATGTLTGTLNVPSSGGQPQLNLPINLSNSTSPGTTGLYNLTTSPTQIAIPSGCRFVWIQGPSGNTENICVGSSTADLAEMQVLDPVNPALLPLIASSPTLYMACSASTVTGVAITFW